MTSRSTRRAGMVLAVVALVAIGAATLRPAAVGAPVTFGHWCIVCGTLGLADVIANVLLFVPLGVGLRAAGLRWRSTLLVSLAVTVGVELLQLTVFTGRFATLGDVVMNTAGGVLGHALAAHARPFLLPAAHAARRLALMAAAGWLAVVGATGWVLGRDASSGPRMPSAMAPPYPDVQWYNGGVPRAAVDGVDVTRPDVLPVALTARTSADTARVDAWVTPTDTPRARVEFLVAVYDAERRTQLVLGRRGRDLVFRARTRAAAVRLRQPTVVIRDAFPAHEPLPAPGMWGLGPTTHVVGAVSGHALVAGIERDGRIEWHRSALSPMRGWSLLLPPFRSLDGMGALLTALWIAALTLPVGYWCAHWAAEGGRAPLHASAFATAVAVAGLLVVPRAMGYTAATPTEWLACAGGLAAGWPIAVIARRLVTSSRVRGTAGFAA